MARLAGIAVTIGVSLRELLGPLLLPSLTAVTTRGNLFKACIIFLLGCFIAPVAVFFAYVSAGGGHGDYQLARVLFPYSFLLTLLTDGRITTPLVVLGWAQFPIYGLIIGIAALNGREVMRAAACIIVVCHGTAVSLCFFGLIPNFS